MGSGQFGRVLEAEAIGLKGSSHTRTTVAVKITSPSFEGSLQALIKELQVMIYLGAHLNIVNLLGACTKNIANKGIIKLLKKLLNNNWLILANKVLKNKLIIFRRTVCDG